MMIADRPLVSVVVLSYERPEFLKLALDSLVCQSYKPLEIIVVDNKSRASNQIAKLVGQYPAVRLITNNQNLGFTGGMNKGIGESLGKYVYLTEDDVLVDENCIATLVAHMENKPATGLAAPIMYNWEEGTIKCAGGKLALEGVFRKTVFGEGETDTGQFNESFDVGYVSGASIFSSLQLLRRLKGFREDFFMYAEDNDLCLRVLKSGLTITVVPQAKVFHCELAITPIDQKIEFHKTKNFFSLYLLHARLRVLPEFYFRYGVIGLLRAAVLDRQRVWPRLKASGWFLLNAPSLIADRYRGTKLSAHERALAQPRLKSSL